MQFSLFAWQFCSQLFPFFLCDHIIFLALSPSFPKMPIRDLSFSTNLDFDAIKLWLVYTLMNDMELDNQV